MTAIHRLSQLDNDNAGYAEKLLQASTVGPYCKRLVGIIQVKMEYRNDDFFDMEWYSARSSASHY